MITVTYIFKVNHEADIEVSMAHDPTKEPGAREFAQWCSTQICINGRVAWTNVHPVANPDRDHYLQVAHTALTLFYSSMIGVVPGRQSDGERTPEWRGWAEPYAEHVRVANQALYQDEQASGVPFTVQTPVLGESGVFGPSDPQADDGADGAFSASTMLEVPVTVVRTEDPTELWDTTEVARWWGLAESAVSSTMQRVGVPVDSREPGQGTRDRYRVVLVRAAKARNP